MVLIVILLLGSDCDHQDSSEGARQGARSPVMMASSRVGDAELHVTVTRLGKYDRKT